MLLRSRNETLTAQLMNEIGVLKAKVEAHRQKLQSIVHMANLSPEDEQDSEQHTDALEPENNNDAPTASDPTPWKVMNPRFASCGPVPFITQTIFYHPTEVALPVELTIHDHEYQRILVDAVMSCKIFSGHALGYEFLIKCAGLSRSPISLTTDIVRKYVRLTDFYSIIADSLKQREQCQSVFTNIEEDFDGVQLPGMEIQRRSVVLCARELVARWRHLYPSQQTCIAAFWGVYRLFLFMSFPTHEHLAQTPTWMWPVPSQLQIEHPGFIDCLPWPALRAELLTTWPQYNAQSLCVVLVSNWCFDDVVPSGDGTSSVLRHDSTGLSLDPAFEAKIYDNSNFRMSSNFAKVFPEMAEFVRIPSSTNEEPLMMLLPTPPCSEEGNYHSGDSGSGGSGDIGSAVYDHSPSQWTDPSLLISEKLPDISPLHFDFDSPPIMAERTVAPPSPRCSIIDLDGADCDMFEYKELFN